MAATGEAIGPEPVAADFEACWQHPLSEYRRRSGDRTPIKYSDFFTPRRRLEHPIVGSFMREWDVRDQLWIDIAPSFVRTRKFLVDRASSDFGERERAIAVLLQPHLAAAYRNAACRRLVSAAIAAATSTKEAVVLIGVDDETVYVSPAAHDLIERWFGSNARLPESLARWHAAEARDAFVLERGGRRLVVERAGRRDALILREETGEPLTRRERDVLLLVARGKSNKEIALDLWVTTGTVKKHLEHTYVKLGVTNRTAAAAVLGA